MKLFLLCLLWSLCLAYTTAEVMYRSEDPDPIYGPPSPCPGFQKTNATYFNVSISAENSEITLRFFSSGLNTPAGNASVSFALFGDGKQVLPILPLVRANGESGSPLLLSSSLWLSEYLSADLRDSLPASENITAQLRVYATSLGGQFERIECVQSRLRKEVESGGESNSTSSNGAGAPSEDGKSTSDDSGLVGASDKGSGISTSGGNGTDGASVPQIAFSLVM